MSTTKDKSQAELLAEREYPEHIITHETLDHSFDLHSGARKAFIKGYSAGQADRDELVKALRPFAQCACSPEGECRCYNCIARDTINRTNP